MSAWDSGVGSDAISWHEYLRAFATCALCDPRLTIQQSDTCAFFQRMQGSGPDSYCVVYTPIRAIGLIDVQGVERILRKSALQYRPSKVQHFSAEKNQKPKTQCTSRLQLITGSASEHVKSTSLGSHGRQKGLQVDDLRLKPHDAQKLPLRFIVRWSSMPIIPIAGNKCGDLWYFRLHKYRQTRRWRIRNSRPIFPLRRRRDCHSVVMNRIALTAPLKAQGTLRRNRALPITNVA